MNTYEEITVRLPKKADYVSLIRLTVSGIASVIGFDIDTIEDIKVAVSEVCNRIISIDQQSSEYYDIIFQIFPEGFIVQFTNIGKCARSMFEGESGEFARAIISSLMDEFTIKYDDACIITMGKNLGDHENEQ